MPVEYFFVHKIKLNSQEKLVLKIFYKFFYENPIASCKSHKKIIKSVNELNATVVSY